MEIIEMIDFEKRLSGFEHLVLYYYDVLKHSIQKPYCDFEITERLISNYNDETEEVKKRIAMRAEPKKAEFERRFYSERWKWEKPVFWSDRSHTDYFKAQLKESHRFEVYVESIFMEKGFDIGLYYGRGEQYSGESQAGIEIKLDKKLKETGNVYIEYQERMRGNQEWVNSGILKDDNSRFLLIGDESEYYILRKSRLIEYYKRSVLHCEYINGLRVVREKAHQTSKGYIMSSQIARVENVDIDTVIYESKIN